MVEVLVAKIVFAVIASIIIVYFLPVGISTFGFHICPQCGFLVNTFIIGAMPVLIVFIGFYKVISVFTG